MTTLVWFEGALRIELDFAQNADPLDVEQALHDEFGHTGIIVDDLIEWESDSIWAATEETQP